MAIHQDDQKRTGSRSQPIGCMLGGAVGDALGAPVAFSDLDGIRLHHGRSGIVDFENAYGRKGAITDATRLALFTAEGLVLSRVRQEYAREGLVIPAIYHACLRWLYTQETHRQGQLVDDHGTCAVIDGILSGHRALFSPRAPDRECLSVLRSGRMGTIDRPINDSDGCGGLLRAAPIGLAYPDAEESFRLGCACAAITHGHPTGYLCAGFLSALISRIVAGESLMGAIADATRILTAYESHAECLRAVEGMLERGRHHTPSSEAVERLVTDRTAAEVLAVGLFCALDGGADFRQGVLLAVNHSGDSASTASVTGNIIGARYGVEVIPDNWLADLELKDLIEEMAVDLYAQFS